MANYAILILIAVYLVLRAAMPVLLNGRANAEEERIRETLRQRIMRDPYNGAAYHELARSYAKQGKLREALQVYQQMLPYISEVERFDVNQRMQDLNRDIQLDQATRFRTVGVRAPKLSNVRFCPACGSSNHPNAGRCYECAQILERFDNPLDNFHDKWQNPSFRRTVTDIVVGIPMAGGLIYVCYGAPVELKIVAILMAFIVIGWQVALRISGR
jgi:pentatricopeptide repeat protein